MQVDRNFYQFGSFRLDATQGVLFREGRLVRLPPKALATLLVLVQHKGEIVSKDLLMEELWPDQEVEEGNLAQNIFLLRRALGEAGRTPRYVETVPKRGYRFIGEVEEILDGLELTEKGRQWSSKRYTESPEAYQAYLRGCYSLCKHTGEGLGRAIDSFHEAIRLDPTYALAYTRLIDCRLRLATNYLPPPGALPAIADAIQRMEMDDSSREVRGLLKMRSELDRKNAEIEIKRAIDLNSNYPSAHQWSAAYKLILDACEQTSRKTTIGQDRPSASDPTLANQFQSLTLTPDEQAQVLCIIAREQFNAGNYEAGRIVLQGWWTMGEWPKLEGLSRHSSADLLFTTGLLTGCLAGARPVQQGQKHAEELLNGSIALFEQLGLRTRSAEARIQLAFCYCREGLFDLARHTVLAALEALSEDDPELMTRALVMLADTERHRGCLHDALAQLGEAAKTLEQASILASRRYHITFGLALRNLATVERHNEYFDRAIEHYEAALHMTEAIGDHRFAAHVNNNYGLLLLRIKRFDEAELRLLRSRDSFAALGDTFTSAFAEDSLAQLHIAVERFDLAEREANRAVVTIEASSQEAGLAELLMTHGIALCRLARHAEAKRSLDRARQIAERRGATEYAGRALLVVIEEMSEELEEHERRELARQLDHYLANSPQSLTRERLGKYRQLVTSSQ